ncbi:MAG: protein phosphatase CheZ [Azoarcus sp.]|jgi:chemotaxis protein CheZ|nr:protein phosphatase CheZ [Azoarcus sp.]
MAVKRTNTDETGDSDDLQALFDSIAAGAGGTGDESNKAPKPKRAAARQPIAAAPVTPAPVTPAPAAPVTATPRPTAAATMATNDSDDLQALFDAEASKFAPSTAIEKTGEGDAGHDTAVFKRIGKMTRKLHDTLVEIGLASELEKVAHSIPDARQRLTYVAQMTEQAASRVLNAIDIAKPVADRIGNEAGSLRARWDKLYANQLSTDEFKALAGETRVFLGSAADGSRAVNVQLQEIMMAQDFQDLTGQVIKKTVEMAQSLESQLLEVLLEVAPEDVRAEKSNGLLNGPVVSSAGRDDVVTSQGQVDDLLESLGF